MQRSATASFKRVCVHSAFLVSTAAAHSLGQTVSFNNTAADPLLRGIWATSDNWSTGVRPGSSDTARFGGISGTLETGTFANATGSVIFAGQSGFSSTVAGLRIVTVPSNLQFLDAGSSSGHSTTLNFGTGTTSTSTFTYGFSGVTVSDPTLYIGKNRATRGEITTNINGLLNFRTRVGQYVSYRSKIIGAGSINIGSTSINGVTDYGAELGAGLILGAAGPVPAIGSTFSGGVTVEGGGLLGLGESSVQDVSGNVISGPIGTGTLTINGGRIAAYLGDDIDDAAEPESQLVTTIANPVTIAASEFYTIGNNLLTFSGPVNFNSGTQTVIRVSPGPSISPGTFSFNHEFSLAGPLTATSGFRKLGMGTLRLSGNNGTLLSGQTWVSDGTLLVASNSALGTTGTGNDTLVDDSVASNGNPRIRFADNVNYASNEILSIRGDGGTFTNGAAVYGGDLAAATFGGTLNLLGSSTVQAGMTNLGGLTLNGTIAFGSGTTDLTRIGAGTFTLDNVNLSGSGTLNLVISQRITADPDPLVVNVGSGVTTVLNGRVRGGDGTQNFAGIFVKGGNGTLETRSVRVRDELSLASMPVSFVSPTTDRAQVQVGRVRSP